MEKGVPVRSISRTLAVLQAVNAAGSLNLQQIADLIAIPYASAVRLVQTLVVEGFLEREAHQKLYRPTALVLSLSSGFDPNTPLILLGRPIIKDLTNKINWPVSIATRTGQMMMVRDSTHLNSPLTFAHYRPGFTMPILECGVGLAYLAYSSDAERENVFEGMAQLKGQAPVLRLQEAFEQQAPLIRARGYATKARNRFTATPGKTSSIATPVFENGRVVAALSMVFFSSAMTMQDAETKYAGQILAAAQDVSRAVSAAAPAPTANAS